MSKSRARGFPPVRMSEMRFAISGRFRSSASSAAAARPIARNSSSSTGLKSRCSNAARLKNPTVKLRFIGFEQRGDIRFLPQVHPSPSDQRASTRLDYMRRMGVCFKSSELLLNASSSRQVFL